LPPTFITVRLPHGGMPESFSGQRRECRVELDAGEAAAELEGG
jgi:hypothetical protein